MSLALQGRGVFGFSLGGLGSLGRGTLDRPGSQGRLSATFCLPSPLSPTPIPLLSYSPSSVWGLALAASVKDLELKGAIEPASSEPGFYSRLFVMPKVTGVWRPVIDLSRLNHFVQLSHFSNGDIPVGPPVSPPRGLDGFHQPSRRLHPGSSPPDISAVSPVLHWRADLPVSGSLLWAVIRSTSLHTCHGPDLLHHASFWVSDPPLSGRLACPWVLPSGDYAGEGLPVVSLCRAGGSSEPLQKLPYPCSDSGLPRHDSPVYSFEGFPDPSSDPESSLSRRRVLLFARAAAQSLEVSVGSRVVAVRSHSGVSSSHAAPAAPSERVWSSVVGGLVD